MAEDLPDDAGIHTLFKKQGRCRVTRVLKARVTDACSLAEPPPVVSVGARSNRLAERGTESRDPGPPTAPRRFAFLGLELAM